LFILLHRFIAVPVYERIRQHSFDYLYEVCLSQRSFQKIEFRGVDRFIFAKWRTTDGFNDFFRRSSNIVRNTRFKTDLDYPICVEYGKPVANSPLYNRIDKGIGF